ncbi:hypothetical protein INT43_000883 [Umbelopsis isabellina]|uniref:DNA mismatch repair protein MSH3 n=1 Tax=Mortierella isabellina TaxID=91625 RepID=A0A8H7UJ24_MORIS|nr:hypothetical protein INT43_000883 [Umbelopsis isabellina]
MGARLLRISILQPLKGKLVSIINLRRYEAEFQGDLSTIETRLDAVEALSSFKDLDKVISMTNCERTWLAKICAAYGNQRDVFEQYIKTSMEEDAGYQKSALAMRNQRCYAIKSGICGMLDVARQTYKEAVNDIYELAAAYCEETSMGMKVRFSENGGIFLCLPSDTLKRLSLPSQFINIVERKKQIHFTTIELLQLNYRVSESLSEIYRHSDRHMALMSIKEIYYLFINDTSFSYIQSLLNDIRKSIHILYNISEAVAFLNMCMAFAHMCTIADYVRPDFSDTMALKSARHPIRERLSSNQFIANDIYASESTSFQIVTGPNMSGKSTYLRTVALLYVMAQIGSFVPAEYACFRLTDNLFTRLPVDDSADTGLSSFMVEMTEISYLLQNVTSNILVIMDELRRATSTSEALAIATAVCEELIGTKAFVYFATHLHELVYTLDAHINVVKLQLLVKMGTLDRQSDIQFLYKVHDGSTNEMFYGLKAAQMVGLPEQIIDRAYNISKTLHDQILQRKNSSELGRISEYYKLLTLTVERLRLLKPATAGDMDLSNNLKSVKDDYQRLLSQLSDVRYEV